MDNYPLAPILAIYGVAMLIALYLLAVSWSRIRPMTWIKVQATIVKVELDSDQSMYVTVSYPVAAGDASEVALREATLFAADEPVVIQMFGKAKDRLQRQYDVKWIDIWYAHEAPEKFHRVKPDKLVLAIGGVVGTVLSLLFIIGISYALCRFVLFS